MLTYLAAVAVVVIVLYASFRALGGGGAVSAGDCTTFLAQLGAQAADRAGELDEALSMRQGGDHRPGAPADPLTEAAGVVRRRLGGYQQQLARIETGAVGEEGERLENARALIAAAVEELGWACRMIEAGAYRDNPGIERAVGALRDHGRECLAAARAIVGSPPLSNAAGGGSESPAV